ncbi:MULTISPECIES: hypothetical protein [Helicobacter]|uniref:hypothetical protein n=1 Tax=Helicobacter TaxID=209 RepID=UPI0013760243|nr:hypothetical protein [Helicobacter sp. MIT 03-1616]
MPQKLLHKCNRRLSINYILRFGLGILFVVNAYGYSFWDFASDERITYSKTFYYDKELGEQPTFGGDISHFSIIMNVLGTEYGFVFNESPLAHNSLEQLSQKHIAFDFGTLSFGGVGQRFPQFFGAKFRYEYGFNEQTSHRFGVEGYWHPTFFNIRGWQILSLYVGGGYRDSAINGAYFDKGILILPSSPIYLALTHRTDYTSHYPSQDSLMLSIRMPIYVWGAPLVIPFGVVMGGLITNAKVKGVNF